MEQNGRKAKRKLEAREESQENSKSKKRCKYLHSGIDSDDEDDLKPIARRMVELGSRWSHENHALLLILSKKGESEQTTRVLLVVLVVVVVVLHKYWVGLFQLLNYDWIQVKLLSDVLVTNGQLKSTKSYFK